MTAQATGHQRGFIAICGMILGQKSGTGKPSAVVWFLTLQQLGKPISHYMPPGRVTAQELVETANTLFYEV